jgi:hypothetical protein
MFAYATRGAVLLPICLCAVGVWPAAGAIYYVSSGGDDSNDGRSPQAAWRTLDRVNEEPLQPGDCVLLRRGDLWRGQLLPRSGSEGQPVTYGAYGEGPKPIILGSVSRSSVDDWWHEGGNIWSTKEPTATGPELLPDPVLAADPAGCALWTEGGASASLARDAADPPVPAAYRVDCVQPGTQNNHIQVYIAPLSIERGKRYRLSFSARCTQPAYIQAPQLMSSRPPWSGYSVEWPSTKLVETTWKRFVQCYQATVTAEDARLTFFLGGRLPEGASLYIADLTFAECDSDYLRADVGNIILGDEAACGVKVWNEDDLKEQGQFWYDEDRQVLKMYSTECPATRYGRIECALGVHIINEHGVHHVTYENLALKYGGAHGIGGGDTHHITVRDCDLSFIGGADQYGGDRTVRFGNGIEFWGSAHDNLVERCRLWEIYDAALTNQNLGRVVEQANICYRNNVIWNCEYSFEYWNRPEESVTRDIYFEHNTCVNAGHGWGHSQRPDPSGRHLCFYDSPAKATNIVIRDNIFFEARANAFFAPGWPPEAVAGLVMDRNAWYQAEGVMIRLSGAAYTMAEFGRYQAEQQKEPNSIVADPLFADPATADFRLLDGSPCKGIGAVW